MMVLLEFVDFVSHAFRPVVLLVFTLVLLVLREAEEFISCMPCNAMLKIPPINNTLLTPHVLLTPIPPLLHASARPLPHWEILGFRGPFLRLEIRIIVMGRIVVAILESRRLKLDTFFLPISCSGGRLPFVSAGAKLAGRRGRTG